LPTSLSCAEQENDLKGLKIRVLNLVKQLADVKAEVRKSRNMDEGQMEEQVPP
jgi:hypothetical protein